MGAELQIENIYKLALPFSEKESLKTISDLTMPFRKYLKSVHSDYPINLSKKDIIVSNESHAQVFTSAFSSSDLNDLNQERLVGHLESSPALETKSDMVRNAIKKLRNINPILSDIFEVTVHSIIICTSNFSIKGMRARGGTTSKCIGLIWLSISSEMSEENILEMLIHELTHTLIFIDELNYEHFDYTNLPKKEFWATSSILKKSRPMDKVVHSILVSIELLLARRTFLSIHDEKKLIHPNTSELISNLNRSIDSVLEHPNLDQVCRPRAIELVLNTQKRLIELERDIYASAV